MPDLNEFIIELQARLNREKSKENIDTDISTLQNQVKKIKLQAELDTKNINTGQKLGKQMGESINQGLSKSLRDVKHTISSTIQEFDKNKLKSFDLSKLFNLNRADIDPSVTRQVHGLVEEINALSNEVIKTNSNSSWENVIDKVQTLYQTLKQFGAVGDKSSFDESIKLLDWFNGKSIYIEDKSEALQNTGKTIRELQKQYVNLVKFTTSMRGSVKLDTVWDELVSISPGLEKFTAFGDQLRALEEHFSIAKEAKFGLKNLIPASETMDVSNKLTDFMDILEKTVKRLSVLREEQAEIEQMIASGSTASADKIVENENRKQQAYQQTADAKKQLSKDEALIKSGANVVTFENTNEAARDASRHFKELLKDENALIAVSERFNKTNELSSFAVNIKRASGEVETLWYALKKVGNTENPLYKFVNIGAELNSSGAVRQVKAVENAFASFTQKYEQFKSSNNRKLSGLTEPMADFESKLSGLKSGINTIDDVRNSLYLLKAAASEIDAPLKRQLSTFDKYKNSIEQGKESISGYRAELKGLSNAPKELSQDLTKAAKLLMQINKTEAAEGTTANWSNQAREFADLLETIKNQILVLKKEQSANASSSIMPKADVENLLHVQKILNTVSETETKVRTMLSRQGFTNIKISGIEDTNGKVEKLTVTANAASGALEKFDMVRQKVQGGGKGQKIQDWLVQSGDVQVLKSASTVQEELAQKTERANAKLDEQSIKLADKIQLSIDTGGYESKVDSLISRTQQWTDEFGSARIITAQLSESLNALADAGTAYAENPSVKTAKALADAESKLDIEIKKVTNSVKSRNSEFMKSSAVDTLRQKYQNFYNENSASHRQWGAQLKQAMLELASGAEISKRRGEELKQELIQIQNAAKQAGKLGKSGLEKISEGFKVFGYWTSPTFLFMKAFQSIKSGIGTVRELDTALVDLKKTTAMTAGELEDFYYASNDVAKQMGVSTEEILKQAAAWSRLGFSSEAMATKMAKYSSMFASISPGLDLDSATDGLVSTMKAFSIGLDNADDVVDGIMSKINIIGNSKALNNSDIVDFLTRSSSALASANNSIEESIAMGEAIIEITRDAAGAGQVMKTTSMRIRGYDEEVEAYTEELENLKGEIADLTKTAKTPGGISLFTDETKETYKSTYKILEEISTIWNDLTDKNQAQLLEVLAGKRNGQALAALISNFKSAQESMDLMANSAGNAEKEMSVIMDSLDFKLNRLSETGTSVAQNLFKRDDMKTVVDGLTSVMNVIDSLTSKLGLFGSIGLGAGIFAGVKNVGAA